MSAIVGVGQTEYSRRSGRSVVDLAVRAARAALADAGLGRERIDGVIPVGGAIHADDLIMGLGLDTLVFDAVPAPGGNGAVASLALARTAIGAGRASTVLVVCARNGSSGARIARRVGSLPGQQFRTQLEHPHGWSTPAEWYAMICRRHMHVHGTTKDHLAAVALTMRQHAQLNPAAMMHGRPLTLEEYHAAPMVADPYQKFDCCLETDGAAAVVVTATPPSERERAVALLAVETGRPSSPDDLTNREDWLHVGLTDAAPRAYEAAGLGPADVDAAMIYDCFTFEALHQLEEAGLCERGEAGPLAASGAFRLGGRLPVNPHGGLLSEGHVLGMNHVVEGVRQARGECGARQVAGARVVAVTGWGDWGDGSLALLGA